MRSLAFILAPLVLLVAACAAVPTNLGSATQVALGGPVTISNQTTIDETAGTAIELAYQAAARAAEVAVDAGFVKGADAAKLQAANNRAYQAVLAARAAYRAGNESSWITATADAKAAISALLAAAKGSK